MSFSEAIIDKRDKNTLGHSSPPLELRTNLQITLGRGRNTIRASTTMPLHQSNYPLTHLGIQSGASKQDFLQSHQVLPPLLLELIAHKSPDV